MGIVKFSFPTIIHFGSGARASLAEHLNREGFARPLLVTDKGIAKLSFCQELSQALSESGLSVATFSDISGNPVTSQVTAGVNSFRAHRADAIIGLGGGAAIDVAKAIAMMVHHPGQLFDYEDDMPGARQVDQAIVHWVAVPTTSGTGSEVGRSSVISDESTHLKKIIFSPRLLAKAVFADPELTVGLPKSVTAATGMDAITHNVEAYLAKNYHPMCDGLALEGLRLCGRSIVNAVESPSDLAARGDMLMGSMMGAVAFQKGLGITHSCAHALGTVLDMHHGLANGIMIDFALRHNLEVAADRFRTMGETVGLKSASPNAFLEWLRSLKTGTGIPPNLRAAGVSPAQLADLCNVAEKDSCHLNNPTPCSRADFERVFGEAFA